MLLGIWAAFAKDSSNDRAGRNIFQVLGKLSFNGSAVDEAGLLAWANAKVAGKELPPEQAVPPISGFQDKSMADSRFLLHMIDAVRPEAVDWAEVSAGGTEEERHENASYAISIARKIGCKVFLTWEDIVEVQPKMITTLLAAALLVEQAPSEEEMAALRIDAEEEAAAQAAEDARKLAESK